LISLEHPLRAGPAAIGGEVEHHVGMVAIPQMDPEPALVPAFDLVQYRHRRVVGLDHPRLEDLAVHLLDDRLQQAGADGHPVAGRRPRQLDAMAAENPFLAIQR